MTRRAVVSGGVDEAESYPLLTPTIKKQAHTVWSESIAYATTFSGNNIDQLLDYLQEEGVKIDNQRETKDFLTEYNHLVTYMYNIPSKVSEYFGDADVKLSLFRDFDSETDNPELFIEIKTSLSPQEANKRLGKIYREWFLPLRLSLDKLNISLNFS